MKDKLLAATICKLTQIYINRQLKKYIKLKGVSPMTVTVSLGSFGITIAPGNAPTDEFEKDKAAVFSMNMTDSKTVVEMNKEEVQIVHDHILADAKSLRETVVVPIINLFDKYMGKGFDLFAAMQGAPVAPAAVPAAEEESAESIASKAVAAAEKE